MERTFLGTLKVSTKKLPTRLGRAKFKINISEVVLSIKTGGIFKNENKKTPRLPLITKSKIAIDGTTDANKYMLKMAGAISK
ncbi:hypothetical protein [Aestuariibaculum sediminum]|uniref:hypothetical protein n=1 Tax=Aestuariibaculum sediminum TaxID=2770637 RepID=UPI0021D20DAE|nr:hypothetical protein [Aestuariibaculum sediminum]